MVDHHLFQSRSAFCSWECWWSLSAVSCRCIKSTISKRSGYHTNQYPVCNHWNYCSVLRSCSTRCHLIGPTPCSRDHPSHPHGHRLKMITEKEDHASVSWGGAGFSQRPGSGWNGSGELEAVYLSERSQKQMPLTYSWSSTYVGTQAPELEHQHWSHVTFGDESRGSIYNSNGLVRVFVVFSKD